MLPKGLGNLGDLAGMMKQAMAMKGKMEEVKEELAGERVEASVGGGMVTVVVSGKMEVLSVTIEPEVLEDRQMVETLVCAGVNEALRKAQELLKAKMKELTGGMDIPGLT